MINMNAKVIASTFFNCRPGKPKEGINLSDGFVLSLGSNSVSNNTCSLVLLMETTQISSGYIYMLTTHRSRSTRLLFPPGPKCPCDHGSESRLLRISNSKTKHTIDVSLALQVTSCHWMKSLNRGSS